MLNKSKLVALPSVKGNQIKMAKAPIPISNMTALRNIIEYFFIMNLRNLMFINKSNKYLLINNKYLLQR